MEIIQGWGGGIEEGDVVVVAGWPGVKFSNGLIFEMTASCKVDVSVCVRHVFDLFHGFFDVMGSLESNGILSRVLSILLLNVRV